MLYRVWAVEGLGLVLNKLLGLGIGIDGIPVL